MITQDEMNAIMDTLTEEQKIVKWQIEEDDTALLDLTTVLLNFANAVEVYLQNKDAAK